MKLAKLAAASALVLIGTFAPAAAQAAWPLWGWYGYGLPFAPPTDYAPRPPYYALYPPVYYSPLRMARPYGASPFAWYPGMSLRMVQAAPTSAVASAPLAQWIENPFVPRKQAASAPKPREQTGNIAPHQFALLENPYFGDSKR